MLTSQNIRSDHTEKLENRIRMIYYIVFSETRKNLVVEIKIFNIVVLKKLRCDIKRKLNGANNCFTFPICLSLIRLGCINQFYEKN